MLIKYCNLIGESRVSFGGGGRGLLQLRAMCILVVTLVQAVHALKLNYSACACTAGVK